MVVEDSSNPTVPIEQLPSFSAIIIPDVEIRGNATALAMNSWILVALEMYKTKMNHYEFIKRYKGLGIPQETLDRAFKATITNEFEHLEDVLISANKWLDEHFGTKSNINVAGKNVAGFDMQFLPYEFAKRFRHRVIDPGSVFIDWSKDRVDDSNEIARRTNTFSVSHDALGDARDVITWLRHSYPKNTP